MSANGNEEAFPCYLPPLGPTGKDIVIPGLTKRELFAAMAMQGLAADNEMEFCYDGLATASVKCADALLAALAEEAEG